MPGQLPGQLPGRRTHDRPGRTAQPPGVRRAGTAGPGRGGAGAQRGGRPGGQHPAAAPAPVHPAAVLVPHHDRRQRQHRLDVRRRRRLDPGARPPAGGAPAGQGPRPRAAGRVVALGRRRPRLHGRGPLHRPERVPAAGRLAGVGPLRHRDRHPAGARLPGRARRAAGGALARLQPDPARHAGRAVQRRAVRVQGDPPGRGRAAAAAGGGHRLVLRHRAAGARAAQRAAHPRGAGRLGRRPGQPGGPGGDGGGRPARGGSRRSGVGHRTAAAAHRALAARPGAAGAAGRGPGDADPPAGAVRGRRGGEHAGLPGSVPAVATGPRRTGVQPGGAAAHGRGQHGCEPSGDVRGARPGRPGPAPAAGAWRCSVSGWL